VPAKNAAPAHNPAPNPKNNPVIVIAAIPNIADIRTLGQ
jgi:hypothetical protein